MFLKHPFFIAVVCILNRISVASHKIGIIKYILYLPFASLVFVYPINFRLCLWLKWRATAIEMLHGKKRPNGRISKKHIRNKMKWTPFAEKTNWIPDTKYISNVAMFWKCHFLFAKVYLLLLFSLMSSIEIIKRWSRISIQPPRHIHKQTKCWMNAI